ncbi:hypothetical protein D3C81_08100 [compost metagenome]
MNERVICYLEDNMLIDKGLGLLLKKELEKEQTIRIYLTFKHAAMYGDIIQASLSRHNVKINGGILRIVPSCFNTSRIELVGRKIN